MSVRKTIQINPDFFKMNKSKKKGKRQKPHLNTTLKPNNIKKQLLQKIKDHQQQQQQQQHMNTQDDENTEKFKTDFKTSMSYLQKMIGEKKRQRHKRRRRSQYTVRNNNNPNVPTGNINIMTPPTNPDSPTSFLSQKPKWGCLKGGRLPTWKQYQKTLKRETKLKIPSMPIPTTDVQKRREKLSRIKAKIQRSNKKKSSPRMELVTTNRTLKIFRLGKKNGRVGVLIKSGKTRKIIKDEVKILKERSVVDIKKYLRTHNLIKAGSAAPENILRKLFEDSYLAGDIYNKNPDNMIYNYIHNQ